MSDLGRRWPVAAFGPIGRARALGASIPSAAWTEGILDAPYDTAWPWVTDLEVSVPRFDTQVRKLRVLEPRPVRSGPSDSGSRRRPSGSPSPSTSASRMASASCRPGPACTWC